jgi:hypothetical protein
MFTTIQAAYLFFIHLLETQKTYYFAHSNERIENNNKIVNKVIS